MGIKNISIISFIGLVGFAMLSAINFQCKTEPNPRHSTELVDSTTAITFLPPDTSQIRQSPNAEFIQYGRELVVNTRKHLGSEGKIVKFSNQLNCQSCHLEAGAKPDAFSANFLGVAANYPIYRERSGMMESIQYRINDCMIRSMDGRPLNIDSKEMKAMVSYIMWVGKDVAPKTKPISAQIEKLPFIPRAADTLKGQQVFIAKCQLCHGKNGSGGFSVDSAIYYPPLWGEGSFNTAAGLYRITTLAGFIKNNMPFGVTYGKSQLSNEECWDVAAFIVSKPRPHKEFPRDWPDISKKAIDHPYGPFADSFSEYQHKYGPFDPIVEFRKSNNPKNLEHHEK
ncbi:MAG TPA: c-type cytochrome [Niabella sp.]|nr:c-type cytochrome [Niabella sp.]HQW14258.1 c-type cytochrome [Niabella sp.]HQX19658.1 c-type cytochrome [Niabella sp.]HQX39908.1 c-type cytochrome [Niabella sp.]HRB06901.1 c-type cytochrome [Niabella sp.]